MYSLLHKEEQAHEEAIWACSWSTGPDENIVTGSLDNAVQFWSWNEEKLIRSHKCEGHQLGVISTDIDTNGNLVASSSTECSLRVWEISSGTQVCQIDAGPMDSWSVKFSPDGQKLATGSNNGKIHFYSVPEGIKDSTIETGGKFILALAFSPNGKWLAAASQEGIVYIFDVETSSLVHTLEAHAMPTRSLCFTPDSEILLTASDDKYIKLHDITSEKSVSLIGTLPGHTSWALCVDASPDKKQFSSSSADHTVRVWDIGQRQCIHKFLEHTDQVWGVSYNRNGSRLVSVSEDKSINIYNIPV